jgi:hypothetical protein
MNTTKRAGVNENDTIHSIDCILFAVTLVHTSIWLGASILISKCPRSCSGVPSLAYSRFNSVTV